MIQPLKSNWKINEDKGYVPDQIKERVNSESNYEWSKKPIEVYKTCEGIKNDITWRNLLRSLSKSIKQLTP
jgi:hypothetical protein